MKSVAARPRAALLALLARVCWANRREAEPLGRVLQLVDSFASRVQAGAEAEDKAREDLSAWCDDALKNAGSDVKELADKKAELEARIAKAESAAEAAASRIATGAGAEQTDAAERAHSDNVARKAELEQRMAQAQGELGVTSKGLGTAQELLDAVQQSCRQTASDHEQTVKARNSLLNAIGVVKKSLVSATGGSSMLMLSTRAGSDPATGRRASEMVNRLAYGKHHFSDLSQLASNMEAVVRLGEYTGEDVFAKIKAMVTEMIARLERQSDTEMSEKQFCDEQLAKSKATRGDLEEEMSKRKGNIDEASAHSDQLSQDIKDASAALAFLAQSSAKLLEVRQQAQVAFPATKEVLEGGLKSMRDAITSLREYTAGGAEGPRAQLEEVESRIAMHLTQLNMESDGLASSIDAMEKSMEIAKATKEQDVKYLTRERGELERTLSDVQSDTGATGNELDAVKKYQTQLESKCIAKPSSYEERKKHREEEIAGLKEALAVLEGEAIALAQRGKKVLRQQPLSVH